jgi:hypothetical protein
MKSKFPLAVLLSFSLSCGDEPINNTCADPIGTDTDSLNRTSYSCFQENIKSCFRFDFKNGTPLIQSLYSVTPSDAPLFKDLGEFECLKNVKEKPLTGFSYVVEVKLHHGYTIKLSDGSFGRFFIDSWETGSGGVTRVNITRQYSY